MQQATGTKIQHEIPPPTTSFSHDPNDSVIKIVDLHTFSWTPSSCYAYSSYFVSDSISGLSIGLFTYSFDGTNSLLTIIGDSGTVNEERNYSLTVVIMDISGIAV